MKFKDITYQRFLWHMGGSNPVLMVMWKVHSKPSDRDEDRFLNCLKSAMDELPKYCSQKDFSQFTQRYGYTMGGSVPTGMLKLMYKELTNDSSACQNSELLQRCLKYCLSKGNPDLWPDLRAALNGSSHKYNLF